jgi:hypothetical protein
MPMEQHPIPQDVTGYKFRLVGDMTLTQFLELAGGIVGGIIFYALPLPFFFKYPLAILSVGLGVGLAFVPVQGRPMGQWILAFIKSIYSPTVYVWKKQEENTASNSQKIAPQSTIISPPPTPQITTPQPQINIAQQTPTPSTPQAPITSPPTPQITPQPQPVQTTPQTTVSREAFDEVGKPQPSTPLPSLFTPTTPNTLTGMTLTPEGKILEDVIIELQKDGLTVRATKSSKLGQFIFINPLENGTYHIITEKDGYLFQKYALNLTGAVIAPLKLQATQLVNTNQPPAHEQASN